MQRMSERRIAASMSSSPKYFAVAYGSCGQIGCSSSTGTYSGRKSRSGKKKPGTVSLEMFTKRPTPNRIAASTTLKTPMRLFWKTTCGGLCVGSGSAAACTTASIPRTTANISPTSPTSACIYSGSPSSGRSKTGAATSVARISWPAFISAATAAVPTLPCEPVTSTRIPSPFARYRRMVHQPALRDSQFEPAEGWVRVHHASSRSRRHRERGYKRATLPGERGKCPVRTRASPSSPRSAHEQGRVGGGGYCEGRSRATLPGGGRGDPAGLADTALPRPEQAVDGQRGGEHACCTRRRGGRSARASLRLVDRRV